MKYNTNTYVTLYRMGNSYNYFYNMMPTSTGKLKDFDLTYINKKGLVLRFPTAYIKDKIKEYEHHPHMYDVFNEYRAWAKTIQIENHTDRILDTAFGVNTTPTWKDFETFLEDRCFPRTRDKMKLVLEDIGLPFYDTFMIIEKTQGRMAEDDFWIRIEE